MSTEVGKIHYALDLNTNKFDSGMATVGGKLKSIGSELAGFAVKAGVAFGAMATASTVFAIKSASNFEQTRVSLENMLGSADNARKMLKDVSDFAKTTPFEFSELAGATKQLVAYGFTGEEAIETMKNLGDVSSAVGTPINDLTYLMGTLRTQGRALTIDIRQFAQRGIPIYKYLAKTMGVAETAIGNLVTEGKVGFPEVEKAFQAMTSEGGHFYQTMEKQSKTLFGRWSNFKDIIGVTARELVGISETGDILEGSLFDKISKGLATVVEKLPEYADKLKVVFEYISSKKEILITLWNNFKDLTSGLGDFARQVAEYLQPKLIALWNTLNEDLIPALQRFWKDYLEPLMPVIGVALVVAIGLAIDAVNLVVTAFTSFSDWISNNTPLVVGFIGLIGVLKGAMVFDAVVNAIIIQFNLLKLVHIPSLMGSFGMLKAMIATPMIMPAIIIAGALMAITKVYQEGLKLQGILNEVNRTTKTLSDARTDFGLSLKARYERGEITAEQRAQIWKDSDPNKRAMGGQVSGGRPYLVGERGPEMFIPRGSGSIKNDRETSTMGGSVSIYGNINIGSQQDSDNFFARLSRNQQLSSKGLATMAGSMG